MSTEHRYNYEPFECIWWEQYDKTHELDSDTSNQSVNK